MSSTSTIQGNTPDGFSPPEHEARNLAEACEPILAEVVSVEREVDHRPFLERFFSSFFQEKNIKWMLLVGAAIVFGSSLMLVTHQWSHWTSTLKFVAILIYTVAIFGFGQFCRSRLLLNATANVMYGLTLLLLPTCFLALHWLHDHPSQGSLSIVTTAVLTILAGSISGVLSHRIFRIWFHASQPTFHFSYVLLCLAGALPTFTTTWMAMGVSTILWAIATLGVVKVNRHLFWLTEENRWPRVFGFFPISLLSFQLLVLLGTKTFSHMPLEWIGMGCVMMAATVLWTARTVANVFRQRTGNLVRPLPWSIVLPLFVGLVFTAIGVGMSLRGFSLVGPTTYAAVPTILISAVLMATAAYDTRHRGFVYLSLVLLTAAYQCTPTLITDLVQLIKSNVALSLQESRLPIAFYGMTYLPLIFGAAIASRFFQSKKADEFAQPLKHFATFLSFLLWLIALTHFKAIFLVSSVNIVSFAILAVLSRDRRFILPAIVSLIVATISFVPFANAMGIASLSLDYIPLMLSGLTMMLMLSRIPDQYIHRIPCPNRFGARLLLGKSGNPRYVLNLMATCMVIGMTAFWLVQSSIRMDSIMDNGWTSALQWTGWLLAAIWIQKTIVERNYFTGLTAWGLVGVFASHWVMGRIANQEIPLWHALDYSLFGTSVLCLASRWILGCGIFVSNGKSMSSIRKGLGFTNTNSWFCTIDFNANEVRGSLRSAFFASLCDLSFLLTLGGIMTLVIPQLVMSNLLDWTMQLPLSSSAAVAWLLLMACGYGNRQAAVAMGIVVPLWSGAIATRYLIGQFGPFGTSEWASHFDRGSALLIAWTLSSGTLGLALRRIQNQAGWLGRSTSVAWMALVFCISLTSFDWIARIIGCVAIAFAFVEAKDWMSKDVRRMLTAIACNIQWLYMCMWLGGFSGWLISLKMAQSELPGAMSLLILSSAASLVLFDRPWARSQENLAEAWKSVLRSLAAGLSAAMFGFHSISMQAIVAVVAGQIILALAHFMNAIEYKREKDTWLGLTWLMLSIVWSTFQGMLTFSGGSLPLLLIGFAIMILSVANQSRMKNENHLTRPFRLVAMILPMGGCAFVLVLHLAGIYRGWNSYHALTLFCAAGLYFYESVHSKIRYLAIPALAILNSAILIGWKAIGIHDVQFFLVPIGLSTLVLVELLEKELPRASHDPLRYIGALTILVSPIFGLMDGSWLHWISLLALCVVIILIAMGLRLRALMYTGSAFLVADLAGMIIRSSIDNPTMLWVSGLGIGAIVIGLAAYCERRREVILAKIRLISCELATWR